MVQIVYLDADGTLFHHEGYIPKSAFEAIRKAQEKGIKIVLCTGRQLVEIYGDMKKIDYDAVIAGAGGTVLVKEELLFDGRFSQEELERLRQYLERFRIPAVYESREGVFGDRYTKNAMKERLDLVCAGMSEKERKEHGMNLFYESVEQMDMDEIMQRPVSKISFLQTEKPYSEIYEDLHDAFDLIRATFAPLGPESGEIGCQGISKAAGMEIVEKHFGIDRQDTAAIGDGENDLCMFEHAGVAIAMGNAPDRVKEKAGWVTTGIDQDGIFNAFEHLGLF